MLSREGKRKLIERTVDGPFGPMDIQVWLNTNDWWQWAVTSSRVYMGGLAGSRGEARYDAKIAVRGYRRKYEDDI